MFTNLAIKNKGLTLYHADRACRANLRGVHLKKLRAGPTEIQFPQLCLLIYIPIRWFIGSPSYVTVNMLIYTPQKLISLVA